MSPVMDKGGEIQYHGVAAGYRVVLESSKKMFSRVLRDVRKWRKIGNHPSCDVYGSKALFLKKGGGK